MTTSRITLGNSSRKAINDCERSAVVRPWFQEFKQRVLGAIDLDPRFNGFQSLAWLVGIS
jgi:hypothetical protein